MLKLKDGFKGQRALLVPDTVLEKVHKDILCHDLYVTDMGVYPRAVHHFRERPQGAQQYIFIHCVEGRGTVESGTDVYEIGRGECIAIASGVAHRYFSSPEDPWSIYWIHFQGNKAPEVARRLNRPVSVCSNGPDAVRLFEHIYSNLRMNYDPGRVCLANLCLGVYFAIFLTGQGNISTEPGTGTPLVDDALAYMNANLDREFDLKETAAHFSLSSSRFSAVFSKVMNCPPGRYFNMLRMEKACNWLDFSDMKISQIARAFGFDDPYYFTRVFTKTIGKSPSQYRNALKG